MNPAVRPPRGRVTLGFVWLNAERVARLSLGFIQTAIVARHLGPAAFGTLNGSMALIALLGGFATLGLDSIVARRIALEPHRAGEWLGTTLGMRLAVGATMAAGVWTWAEVAGIPTLDRTVTAVVALTLFTQAFLVGEAWFAGTADQRPVAITRVSSQVAAFAIRLALVIAHAGVVAFAAVAVLELLMNALGVFWWARKRSGMRLAVRWREVGADLLREAWPVIVASGAVAICSRLDLVLVGRMLPAPITGQYAAAVRFNELLQFVAAAIPAASIGSLTRLHARDRGRFLALHGALAGLAAWAGVLIAVAWLVAATGAIAIVFGHGFTGAAPYLRVLAWTNVSVFAGSVWSVFWVSERLLRPLMVITATSAAATVALDFWLVPRLGAMGAAIGSVAGQFLPFVLLQFRPESREASRVMFESMAHPWRSLADVRSWLGADAGVREGVS